MPVSWLTPCVVALLQMLAESIRPNYVTYNTLLEVYAKLGMWQEAVAMLDTLQNQRMVPEPRTYNIIMSACTNSGQYKETLAVFDRMQSTRIQPTTGTYNAVITAYCR